MTLHKFETPCTIRNGSCSMVDEFGTHRCHGLKISLVFIVYSAYPSTTLTHYTIINLYHNTKNNKLKLQLRTFDF